MFLFAVGYGVGPQFFRGLKSDGLPQVFFAVRSRLASRACSPPTLPPRSPATPSGRRPGCSRARVLFRRCSGSRPTPSRQRLGFTPEQVKANQGRSCRLPMPLPTSLAPLARPGFWHRWARKSWGVKDLAKECAEYDAKAGGTGLGAKTRMSAYRRLDYARLFRGSGFETGGEDFRGV